MKISNRNASRMVEIRREFDGSNTYGRTYGPNNYAVFSYGPHWPMFVYYRGTWYANSDKYSPTTSKQTTQLHPGVEMNKQTLEEMKALVETMQEDNYADIKSRQLKEVS